MRNILFISTLITLLAGQLRAQETAEVRGTVCDSVSGVPLAYVSLSMEDSPYGTVTDNKGAFSLRYDRKHTRLDVRFLGYETKVVQLEQGAGNKDLRIFLSPATFELKNIIVRPRRERYTRRDNPAVDLIRKVIEHKDANRMEAKETYKVEIYDRLSLSFAKADTNLEKDFLLRKLPFTRNYLDTSALTGNPILTVSVRESLSDYYYRRNPASEKTILKAKRQQGIDRTLDDSGTLSDNLDEILKSVNIFDNDINILLNRFVSPLSSTLAVAYYKYFILDTLDMQDGKCVRLAFTPFNSESYSFTGMLYVLLDGNYPVKKVQLDVPRNINLNWVHQLRIEQEFQRAPDSLWAPKQEDIYASFTAIPGASELYAHRLRSFGTYGFEPGDAVFKTLGPGHTPAGATNRSDTFWRANRPVPLREKEEALDSLLAELKAVPAYNILIKTLEILIADYIPTHALKEKSRFDIGPVYSLYSSNFLEGPRFRIGGMTTANLFPQWFASGYLAYGKADRKLKYQGILTYSFAPKEYHEKEAPINNLSLMYGFDVNTPGQNFLSGNDNLVLSHSVGQQLTHMQYIRKAELRYEKEWANRLSIYFWGRHERNAAAGTLHYIDGGTLEEVASFATSELGFQLRYAPGERPFNGRKGRDVIFNLSKDAPVFRFSHSAGIKGLLGSAYARQHTEAGIEKRIWLSSFGHIDAVVRGGYTWNRLPFPLLILPNTNQSAIIQPEAFAMMRAMEFVSDQYVSLFLTYYMKGWLLNHIPLVKWLRLREVVSLNGIYGSLSDRNNPMKRPNGLFLLPEETVPFGKTPYLEASAGLENIFRIIRIDYYRRLTYLNAPHIKKGGLRIGFRFSF